MKEACLDLDIGKALKKGQIQVWTTSRIVRKTSMALNSKMNLRGTRAALMNLVQVRTIKTEGMKQTLHINLDTVKKRDIVLLQVSTLVMENIGLPQASLPVKEHRNPTQAVHPETGDSKNTDLGQEDPQVLKNMGLA